MKKIFLVLLPLFALILNACQDKPVDIPKADFTLTFKATYDGQPLEKYKRYDYETYKIMLSRFSTYLSDITLLNHDEELKLSDVEWVEFTPDLAPDNMAVEVPITYSVPEGAYTGLKMGFGVRPDLNAKRPADFPAGHPLAREVEYWLGWGSYIFTKVEGQGDGNNDGLDDIFLLYHCGSSAVYRSFSFEHPITVEPGSGQVIEIDVKKLFETNGQLLDLTVNSNQFTSNNPNDVTVATILMNNIGNATTLK